MSLGVMIRGWIDSRERHGWKDMRGGKDTGVLGKRLFWVLGEIRRGDASSSLRPTRPGARSRRAPTVSSDVLLV
jgi:hypothetical protein